MSVQQDVTSSGPPTRAVAVGVDGGLNGGAALCSCTATSLISPAGEIIVLRVSGEVDWCSRAVLLDALSDCFARRPCDLLVDLAGMTFCGVPGLTVLVQAGRTAAGCGTGYAVSAASGQVDRVWALLWPEGELPTRHRTAAAGVVAAMLRQAQQRDRVRAAPSS